MKTILLLALMLSLSHAQTPFQKFASSVVKTSDSGKANALKAAFGGGK